MQTVGPRTQFKLFALASSPSASPNRLARSRSKLAAKLLAAGKHAERTPGLVAGARIPLGLSAVYQVRKWMNID
jgi:hypothetical protein